ncbi:hypothetical protein NR288_24025 [Enterobacter sp. BT855]|uniref:hypothetical protein n=1 Tax=Enterobacteriaceae TaxID=543 RepID=UPI000778BF3F|nr:MULTISPECIES: hypothetical protein [Enterobacteriaceae]EHH6290856.1 hypothetical protein [Escherichia coli]HAF2548962.1 hypothetical protein [Salmonella enterica]EKL0723925.1 hypothetical protein [Citrobacter freundii]EKX5205098.1 hypothetical protein [Citrobacter freundii]EKX5205370.1 hypothetical protein [Citrobacter freundii]
MAIGDDAIRDAFYIFTQQAAEMDDKGLPQEVWETPCFTYLMTKKQFNQMKVVCQRNGWDLPTSPAIPITWAMFRHVLSARNSKDKLSWQECAEILATAFSVQSNVYVNRDYSEQTIVLNAARRINVAGAGFFAMAIVDVSENNLAPVTAYHATEAKCRAIQRG